MNRLGVNFRVVAVLVTIVVLAVSCATVPITGRRTLSLIPG